MSSFEEMDDEERRARRARRLEEMRQAKEKQRRQREMLRKVMPFAMGAICLLAVFLIVGNVTKRSDKQSEASQNTERTQNGDNADVMTNADTAANADATANADNETNTETTENITNTGISSFVAGNIGARIKTVENKLTESGHGVLQVEGASEGEAGTYSAKATEETDNFGGSIDSSNAVLIDLETDTILARKGDKEIINPASMTKVLTILVAAEHVQDLDDTFTITIDITDYSYVNDCSNVGFARDETVTVRDLFYGTILPSGADAAVGLATYVAGSQEAFVELMNEKLDELGLSDTAHFTNCVGLYDENHYCTVYDMAVILKAAIDNEFCREVLSAHTYTTSSTEEHPEGIQISNWFLRRIEDQDCGDGLVVCGKTGYVVESGNCAASYAENSSGKGYICVTVNATSGWKCIYDHAAIYKKYVKN